MADGLTKEEREQFAAAVQKLGSVPWCLKWMSSGMRHLNKNVDHECYETGHEYNGKEPCNRPDRYDGEQLAILHNLAPSALATIDAYARLRTLAQELVTKLEKCAMFAEIIAKPGVGRSLPRLEVAIALKALDDYLKNEHTLDERGLIVHEPKDTP